MPKTTKLVYILILLFTFGQIATDLYLPSLISIANNLNVSTNLAQFSISIFMLSLIISQPIYGIASDAYGRKPLLMIGVIIAILGSLLCFITTNITIFLLGRFLQGLGAGSGNTICRAIVRDLFKGIELIKFSSYLAVYGTVFMITAPILGGYIEHYLNWRISFLILLIFSIINLINITAILTETNNNKNKQHIKFHIIFSNFRTLLKNNNFVTYTLCATIAYANIFAWITAGPILLQKTYALNPINFGWFYFFAGTFYIFGNLFNKYTVSSLGPNKLIMLGFFIQLIVGLSFAIIYILNYTSSSIMLSIMSTMIFGISIVFPNANAGALNNFTHISGTAAALFSIIQTSGAAVASIYIAIMPESGLLPLFLCFTLLSLCGMIISKMAYNKKLFDIAANAI